MLAKAVHQAMTMLNPPTPSRASPLPQGIWIGMKTADSPADQCGHGLARECGASGNDDVESANPFAGKPTPTGIRVALKMVDLPPNQCGSGLARESGASGNDDVECANPFAGKPASQVLVCSKQIQIKRLHLSAERRYSALHTGTGTRPISMASHCQEELPDAKGVFE